MGKGKSSDRGGVNYGAGRGGGKYSPPKYSPPKYGGGRPSGGGKYSPQDTVAIILKRETAVDLLNALIIALGVVPSPWKKGKGKKKDGGGKKYPPKKTPYPGKPTGTKTYGGKPTGGKTYRVKPTGTKSWGGKPKPPGGGKSGRGK
jgi:hypothetical protein